MRTNKLLGQGGIGLNTDLPAMVTELQSMRLVTATGAASATAITVTGMVAGDYVLSVINLTDATTVDLTGLAVGAGSFTVTADTSAKTLLVQWAKKA